MNMQLIRRAIVLFPRTSYLDEAAVRHARRKWLQSVVYLRCASDSSTWILDQPVKRVQ